MYPDHYAELESSRTASHDELRASYLRLARIHHPDKHSAEARLAAETRMQAINDAWAVLGASHLRRAYDNERADVGSNQSGAGHGQSGRSHSQRGRATFRPFDDEPVTPNDDVDLDPTPFTASRGLPQWMAFMPVVLVLGAVGLFFFGLLVAAPNIIAVGAIVFALGAVSFLALPLFVMSRAEKDTKQ